MHFTSSHPQGWLFYLCSPMNLIDLNPEYFYLFDGSEELKRPIKRLSENEVTVLQHSNKVLYEFRYYERRMKEILINLSDFQETVSRYSTSVKENDPVDESLMDEIYINVNRTFINFVTSLKIFVDHINARLRKRYGSDSEQVRIFISATKAIYDNYFAYRLLMNLRNYALHVDYPIDNFRVDSIAVQQTGIFDTDLYVEFNKDKLLADDKMRKKLGDDLKHYHQYFPVKFVMAEIEQAVKKLFDAILKIEKQYFVAQADIATAFVAENPNGTMTTFGKKVHIKENSWRLETVIIPSRIAEQLCARLKTVSEN